MFSKITAAAAAQHSNCPGRFDAASGLARQARPRHQPVFIKGSHDVNNGLFISDTISSETAKYLAPVAVGVCAATGADAASILTSEKRRRFNPALTALMWHRNPKGASTAKSPGWGLSQCSGFVHKT